MAGHPSRLAETSLQVFLTEEQLCYTLPLDIRLQHKTSSEIVRAIYAHAATLLPSRPLSESIDIPAAALAEAVRTTALEQGAAAEAASSSHVAHSLLQQAYLKAAIDALMYQFWHTPNQAQSRGARSRCRLLAVLQRWQRLTRRRVVYALTRWDHTLGQLVWGLIIDVPVRVG